MINRVFKKIYRTLFTVNTKLPDIPNLIKGNTNISIHPTSLLFPSEKGKIVLEGDNYVGRHVEIGPVCKIQVGYGTSLQDRCILLGEIDIGKYCVFAHNVYISSGRHYYDLYPNLYIKDQDEMVANDKNLSAQHSKKVTIGDDCWLGINVVVMSGVTIGRGSVIGANSVVTKDVEPFSIMAGSPAKLIKKRLELTAKDCIEFSNENDYPNFFSGCLVNKKNIDKYHKDGGIAATKNFSLYLNHTAAQIELSVKNIYITPITLCYNNQKQVINGHDYCTVKFNASPSNYHVFTAESVSNENDACLLIKKTELKN